jgi:hypothetical protein
MPDIKHERQFGFFKRGGHSHNGEDSTKIDFSTYTIADVADLSDLIGGSGGDGFTLAELEDIFALIGHTHISSGTTITNASMTFNILGYLNTGLLVPAVYPSFSFNITTIKMSLGVEPTGGSVSVDIRANGTSILSTPLIITAGNITNTKIVPTTTAILEDTKLELFINSANGAADLIIYVDYTR